MIATSSRRIRQNTNLSMIVFEAAAPVAGSLLQASIATSSLNCRGYTVPIRPSTRARIRGDELRPENLRWVGRPLRPREQAS